MSVKEEALTELRCCEFLTLLQGDVFTDLLNDFNHFQVAFIYNPVLRVVAKNYSFSSDDFSFVGRFKAHDHLEKGRFTTSVRPNNSRALSFFKDVTKVFEQQSVRVAFAQFMQLQNLTAQTLAVDFQRNFAIIDALFCDLFDVFESVNTVFRLSRSRARCFTHPVQFLFKQLLCFVQICRLICLAYLFLFEVVAVVPFVFVELLVLELENGATHAF